MKLKKKNKNKQLAKKTKKLIQPAWNWSRDGLLRSKRDSTNALLHREDPKFATISSFSFTLPLSFRRHGRSTVAENRDFGTQPSLPHPALLHLPLLPPRPPLRPRHPPLGLWVPSSFFNWYKSYILKFSQDHNFSKMGF